MIKPGRQTIKVSRISGKTISFDNATSCHISFFQKVNLAPVVGEEYVLIKNPLAPALIDSVEKLK